MGKKNNIRAKNHKSQIRSLSDPITPATNTLTDAQYGVGKASPTVTLEHLKLPGWRPSVLEVPSSPTSSLKWKKAVSQTKPASRTFLNSPRSVHVCMEFGVDPLSLLERDFASFKEKGVSEDLQRTAYQHHLAGRTKTLDSLIAARVNLEPDFSPPSLAMDHDAASFVTKSTPPGENSADAELKKRIVLDEAKRAKHSLKMDANRLAELAGEEKVGNFPIYLIPPTDYCSVWSTVGEYYPLLYPFQSLIHITRD